METGQSREVTFDEMFKEVSKHMPEHWPDQLLAKMVPDTREFVRQTEENYNRELEKIRAEAANNKLPFYTKGLEAYIGKSSDGHVYIKAWQGKFSIKLIAARNNDTYGLCDHLVDILTWPDAVIWGRYRNGRFKGLATMEPMGVHYSGQNSGDGMFFICTGELFAGDGADELHTSASRGLKGLREVGSRAAKSLEVINTNSFGDERISDEKRQDPVLREFLATIRGHNDYIDLESPLVTRNGDGTVSWDSFDRWKYMLAKEMINTIF
jgi:hypothetical protein